MNIIEELTPTQESILDEAVAEGRFANRQEALDYALQTSPAQEYN